MLFLSPFFYFIFLVSSNAKILYAGQVKLEKLIRTDIIKSNNREIKYTFNTKVILLVNRWKEPSLFTADSGVIKKKNTNTFKEVRTSVWNVLKVYKKYRIIETNMVFEQSIVPRRTFKIPIRIYYNNVPILAYKLSLISLKKSGYEDMINTSPLIQLKIDKYSGKAMNQVYEKEFKVIDDPTVAVITDRTGDIVKRVEMSDVTSKGLTTDSYNVPSQSFNAMKCESTLIEDLESDSEELSSSLPEALVQIDQMDKTLTDIKKEVTEKKLEKLADAAAISKIYKTDKLNPLLRSAPLGVNYLTEADRYLATDPHIYSQSRPILPLKSSSLKNGEIYDRLYKTRKVPLATELNSRTYNSSVIGKNPTAKKNYFKRLLALK